MKKKIAVITGWSHDKIGGVENYSSICYENWQDKYEITEFPTLKTGAGNFKVRTKNPQVKIDYSLVGKKPSAFWWLRLYKKTIMKKIYQNFDVVVINAVFPPQKWINHEKSILVQHMHTKWYSLKGKKWPLSLGQFFITLFFGVGTFTNAFKNAQNVVFFIPQTAAKTKTKNINYIPLSTNSKNTIHDQKKNRQYFIFLGRLDNKQKNIIALTKIANLNNDLHIYGMGSNKKIIDKKLIDQTQYKGFIKNPEVSNLLQTSKALLLTSNYEGFSMVIVEALSNGTPVIMFDTFASANFFAKSSAVFLIKKNDIKAFNAKIQWLRNLPQDEYQKISNHALNFAREHLSQEIFWQNWTNVLERF